MAARPYGEGVGLAAERTGSVNLNNLVAGRRLDPSRFIVQLIGYLFEHPSIFDVERALRYVAAVDSATTEPLSIIRHLATAVRKAFRSRSEPIAMPRSFALKRSNRKPPV